MHDFDLTRRAFVASLSAASLFGQSTAWAELFNGRNLKDWKPQRNFDSWKVVDGVLTAGGPMCHLFYVGPVCGANFENFELDAEVLTHRSSDSGIYFHTAWQDTGAPKKGFEVQINNTAPGETRKTASLYNLRNIYKQFVRDDEWFRLNVAVRGKSVQIRLNSMLAVDYVEPTPGSDSAHVLGHGTFALQCHGPNSNVLFRSIRVRPLADDLTAPGDTAATIDAVSREIVALGTRGIPMLDLHVHPKGGLLVDAAVSKSLRAGIQYGLAVNCGQAQPVIDDAGALKFVDSLQHLPVFIGMQAEGREWTRMFSRHAVQQFDYVFSDSMTWTDNHGKRMRTWIPEEIGTISDPQEFMDTLVERTVGILEHEPIDIYANPTYIPDQLRGDYEALWTPQRRERVVKAAAANAIAIEINNRYRIPSQSFLALAKQAGCKFTFGSNNAGAADLSRCEYALQMVEECSLGPSDFFIPLSVGSTKAIERKGNILRSS